MTFLNRFGEDIFNQKYRHKGCETWEKLAESVVEDVCGSGTRWKKAPLMRRDELAETEKMIREMKFIPAGRYLYYAGRPVNFYNNCFAMRAVDSREGWGTLAQRLTLALMIGGGVGVDYSDIRPIGAKIKKTGGVASGPISLMEMVNSIGRRVQQGGSRRSALWAGLNWSHPDIMDFIGLKYMPLETKKAFEAFKVPLPMDMTNMSVQFDTRFLIAQTVDGSDLAETVWDTAVKLMCRTGEPGMSFNFHERDDEDLRNACTEFITKHSDDACNLGSINMSRIATLQEFKDVVNLATRFLICGSIRSELPYAACREVRNEHRKVGLGLMGVHDWLLQRGYSYEMVPELRDWMHAYSLHSRAQGRLFSTRLGISTPERFQAIAPAGTISLLAGTTSGIEPIFAVAQKRRYLVNGNKWKAQYIIDPTAQSMIEECGIHPDDIETAYRLAETPEKRIRFQAEMQRFVDMGISSTVNLPEWGTAHNNPDTVKALGSILEKYRERLRGITVYPNNAIPGQTLREVDYRDALGREGVVIDDSTEMQCKSGTCGI